MSSIIKLGALLPNITEQQYRSLNMFHYTFLAHFARNGVMAFSESDGESDAYVFGSLVDTMLTHYDDFDKLYYVSTAQKQLTPSQETIVNALVEAYSQSYQHLFDIPDENLIDIARSINVYKNYGDEALLKAIRDENCISEYACRVEGFGKTIISKQMFDDAQHRICELLEDNRARELFRDDYEAEDNPIEVLYQSKFVDQEENLKAMVDVLYIDHKNKIIIPYDLKTSSQNTYDFNKSFVKFRYDIQADLYSYLIRKFVAQHKEFQEYKVLPFTFIVLSPNGHIFAEYNAEENVDSEFYKTNMNWRQLYELAQWHISHGVTNTTKEIYENGGILKLKI